MSDRLIRDPEFERFVPPLTSKERELLEESILREGCRDAIIVWDSELEKLMWNVWKDYSDEMQCDNAFDVIATVMADPTANQKLNAIQVVNMPANTPPQIAQQVWNSVIPQLRVESQAPIEIHPKVACVESSRGAYYISTTFRVHYWRDEKMALSVNVNSFSPGWQYEEV